ncbi:MAG: bifunctional N(6)-L-threonylcarbamoyladenine synthase/serine/threonine protein kinase [Candidatus Thermoplasmatota archaeon]|nr:bifunctional N(6)-L-threonylcarbamoyladenine synthase/serine/threonine protein kinase [Candidatus Thermoplasmatota archaeon]
MQVLGIEGTSHTFGAGVVNDLEIVSNSKSIISPKSGGIHPKEAALHHFEVADLVIRESLEKAALRMSDIDLVAFSQGPGLGPCLRVAATAARSIAISNSKPVVGVNHCLGHIEIGRRLGKVTDPLVLYVSGGNTQIIAHSNGRYRVFGETQDIGIGNMLDKLARFAGIPFPGGPVIEEKAQEGNKLLDLPYSVKGMDTSFSGILTAAMQHLRNGERLEDVCFSVQEYSFSMLVEVLERALVHLGKDEILLTGGVAMNGRLRKMVELMGRETAVKVASTPAEYCMDNGSMIGQAGMMMFNSGIRQSISETSISQNFRVDEVDAPWISSREPSSEAMVGSESKLERMEYFGRKAIRKLRLPKAYRIPILDRSIRNSRLRNECSVLARLEVIGVRTPQLLDVDVQSFSAITREIEGKTLRDFLIGNEKLQGGIDVLGSVIGKMHANSVSHGDLTTSNLMVADGIYLIDPSMGRIGADPEDMAADLVTLEESMHSAHGRIPGLWEDFLRSYSGAFPEGGIILETFMKIKKRRRYV